MKNDSLFNVLDASRLVVGLTLLVASCTPPALGPNGSLVDGENPIAGNGQNHTPAIAGLVASPPSVRRAAQVTVTALALDVDGDTLTYAWTLPTGWTFADATRSAEKSATLVAPDAEGEHGTIGLTVDDGKGGTDTATLVVSTVVASAPLISSFSAAPNVVRRGGSIALSVSALDRDASALTYTWRAPSGWMLTPNDDGQSAVLVAPMTASQSATISVEVKNAAAKVTTASIVVATAANAPPAIANLSANITSVLPNASVVVSSSATDADDDVLSYAWTLPQGWSFFDPAHATDAQVTLVAPATEAQSGTLALTVSDSGGESASASVNLSTQTIAAPAVSSLSAAPTLVARGGSISLAVTATDPQGLTLGYSWTAPVGWTVTPIGNGASATLVAPTLSAATATISVEVTNSAAKSTTASVLVATVQNTPPTISSLAADVSSVLPSASLIASASASDADGDTLNYAWTLPSGWAFANPMQTTNPQATLIAPTAEGQSGILVLTISDGEGGTASASINLSTRSTAAPSVASLSAAPTLVARGGSISLAVTATDPQGLTLGYSWTAPVGWTVTPIGNGASATLVAPTLSAATASISVEVTNSAAKSATASVLVATAQNATPTISNLSADATNVLPNGSLHAFVAAQDADGDPITFSWSSSQPDWVIAGTGATVTITAPQASLATTNLIIHVTDASGNGAQSTMVLSTSSCKSGSLNCDGDAANGCEADTTSASSCGGCGIVCGPGLECDHGETCRAPSRSCEDLLQSGRSLGDGVYHIVPDGASTPMKVYCDMTTDGGGWTGIFAGKNGFDNAFDHFEYTAANCADPRSQCLYRLPASEDQAEIMASCGSAKVAFVLTPQVRDYLVNGTQSDWARVQRTHALEASAHPDLATWFFTGVQGDAAGFILDRFASSTDDNKTNDFCNGVYEDTSPVGIFYRSRVDHFDWVSTVNHEPTVPFSLKLRAVDTYGRTIPGYRGTVHFTATGAGDPAPADYTFIAGDAGEHDFTLTVDSGQRLVVATDTLQSSITGSTTVNAAITGTVAAPAASCRAILDASAAAGDGNYIVSNGVSSYPVACDMTTDGGGWTGFFAGINGSPNIFASFDSTVEDCPAPERQCLRRASRAVAPEILVSCGPHQVVFTPSERARRYFALGESYAGGELLFGARAVGGSPALFLVEALYTDGPGFVFGSSGGADIFASLSHFEGLDYCNNALDYTSPVKLYYRNVVNLAVIGPRVVDPGMPFSVTVRAIGPNGIQVPDYVGTVHFSSDDLGPTLPSNYTFTLSDGGEHQFANGVSLAATSGSIALTAVDTIHASTSGTTHMRVGGLGSLATPAASCKAILDAGLSEGDGMYWLTAVGPPVQVYCDMTTNGGGWTLVLKADGHQTTFSYDASAWTDTSVLNPTAGGFDMTEAKLPTWSSVPLTEVQVAMTVPGAPLGRVVLAPSGGAASMFALMSPNVFVPTAAGREAWKSLLPGGSLQANCNLEGFNTSASGSFANLRARIGILANNEDDCDSNDSKLGVGTQDAFCFGDPNLSVGNTAGCGGDAGDANVYAFAWVFVR